MQNSIQIDNTYIGHGQRPYVVAELSGNHNGSLEKAKELITLAKSSGADAVKLQTYTPDTMTLNVDKDIFKIKSGLWKGYSLYDLYKEAHTPWDWHPSLFEHAKEVGISIFSSPFDESAVDFLEELNVPAYKIASFELIDLPLIEYTAKKMKPIIMSTGMASLNEIKAAYDTVVKTGNDKVILLHCVSGYPTPVSEANILRMLEIKKHFNCLVGLSDHTLSNATSVAATAVGACFIEKHFIDSRKNDGPDSAFSLEPEELRCLARDCKDAYESLGKANFERRNAEKDNVVFRRSLFSLLEIFLKVRLLPKMI